MTRPTTSQIQRARLYMNDVRVNLAESRLAAKFAKQDKDYLEWSRQMGHCKAHLIALRECAKHLHTLLFRARLTAHRPALTALELTSMPVQDRVEYECAELGIPTYLHNLNQAL